MKITKSQLKQIIKEEYSSLIGEEPLATDDISAGDEPSMSTGWKLDEILKILWLEYPQHKDPKYKDL